MSLLLSYTHFIIFSCDVSGFVICVKTVLALVSHWMPGQARHDMITRIRFGYG